VPVTQIRVGGGHKKAQQMAKKTTPRPGIPFAGGVGGGEPEKRRESKRKQRTRSHLKRVTHLTCVYGDKTSRKKKNQPAIPSSKKRTDTPSVRNDGVKKNHPKVFMVP